MGVSIPPAPIDTARSVRSQTNSESLMDLRETSQRPRRVLRKLFGYTQERSMRLIATAYQRPSERLRQHSHHQT
jgi:hypothetical protein